MRRLRLNVGVIFLFIYGLYYLLTLLSEVFGQQVAIVFLLVVGLPVALLLILPRYIGNIVGLLVKYGKYVFRHHPQKPVKSKLKQEQQSYEQGYQALSSGIPAQFSETPQPQYPETSQFSEIPQAQYPEIPQLNN